VLRITQKLLYLSKKNSSVFLSGFTRLEKLIHAILISKVSRVTQKLLYLKKKNSSVFLTGFTLIEVLIVVAIMLILLSSGASLLGSRTQEKSLEASAKAVVDHIAKARNYAVTGYFADDWGVKVLDNNASCFNSGDCVVVFKGKSYVSRDSVYDSIFDLKNGVSLASNQQNEFYFSRVAGWLSTTTLAYQMTEQSMILVNTVSEQKIVSTTPAGLVYYGD
jgi:prepilin-type N-terminal cleavage/methylation domain-containing protein